MRTGPHPPTPGGGVFDKAAGARLATSAAAIKPHFANLSTHALKSFTSFPPAASFARRISEYLRGNNTPSAPGFNAAAVAAQVWSGEALRLVGAVGMPIIRGKGRRSRAGGGRQPCGSEHCGRRGRGRCLDEVPACNIIGHGSHMVRASCPERGDQAS